MSSTIMLSVLTGPHNAERYCFRERVICVIGRASDCEVQLSGSIRDTQISRHHCQVEFDPPQVWVTDLGSRNGTFLNGKPITGLNGEHSTKTPVQNNDVLTIGGTTLQIQIVDCPFCLHKLTQKPKPDECDKSAVVEGEEIHVCEGDCQDGEQMSMLPDGSAVHWLE